MTSIVTISNHENLRSSWPYSCSWLRVLPWEAFHDDTPSECSVCTLKVILWAHSPLICRERHFSVRFCRFATSSCGGGLCSFKRMTNHPQKRTKMAISSSNKEQFVIVLRVAKLSTDLKITFQLHNLKLSSNRNFRT